MSSGWVTTLEPVQIKPDVVFHKRYHSALVGTPLADRFARIATVEEALAKL